MKILLEKPHQMLFGESGVIFSVVECHLQRCCNVNLN